MNFAFIFIFCVLRTIEVVSSTEGGFECVKRKSGACTVFNVTDDFDHFIDLHALNNGKGNRISTIIEIDYMANKHSYELEKNAKKKEFDTVDNPVVEILFSQHKNSAYSYRLVLGEKWNRLAFVEIVERKRSIVHNNYSPELPPWPFAINVTVDYSDSNKTELSVYTKSGDEFDAESPFLRASSDLISVRYMSIRSRNTKKKLVGLYDCSTKYGFNCGIERLQTITDCRQKFSPLGSGLYKNFVDMSAYNREPNTTGNTETQKNQFDFREVFGIYRRNNDYMHILFTSDTHDKETSIRITIGDEISVRVRTYDNKTYEYYDKTAVKTGWNQEPSEPNFIKVTMSSESKTISIYNLETDDPILSMKLCDYFHEDTIEYMSVTSDRFKSVDLYYDCCLPDESENCPKRNTIKSRQTTANRADIVELETLNGVNMTRTFLDTSKFHVINSAEYRYENGTSTIDYCPHEIAAGAELIKNSEVEEDDEDEDYAEIEDDPRFEEEPKPVDPEYFKTINKQNLLRLIG